MVLVESEVSTEGLLEIQLLAKDAIQANACSMSVALVLNVI